MKSQRRHELHTNVLSVELTHIADFLRKHSNRIAWGALVVAVVVLGPKELPQAMRVIDGHLLNPKEFFAPHPISTVALCDPKFELRMWRGPAWNCMTYWAARGCARYGRSDAPRRLLEAALDATATQFQRTGTLWEFYHPQLGDPQSLFRKATGRHIPCQDYLGHNPLFAMVDLWRNCNAAPAK